MNRTVFKFKAFLFCAFFGLGDEGRIEIHSGYLKAAASEFQGMSAWTAGHIENPHSRCQAQKLDGSSCLAVPRS
jgi:hypothetical protein